MRLGAPSSSSVLVHVRVPAYCWIMTSSCVYTAFGPGADPEVQKATQKVQDAYYKQKQVQEARARLNAYLEQHGRTVARAPAKRYLRTTVQTEDDAWG